jgi:hypothetical protein
MDKKKTAGVVFIGIAVLTAWMGFPLSAALFVVVGVSLLMDVRIWRG